MSLREHPFAHVPDRHSGVGRVSLPLTYPMNRSSHLVFVIIPVKMKFSVHVGAKGCYSNARDIFTDLEHIDDVIDEVELFPEVGTPDAIGDVEKKNDVRRFVSAVILNI